MNLDRLRCAPRVQQSPYLEQCCLRMCAKASYQQTQTAIAMPMGIRVSAKTQERKEIQMLRGAILLTNENVTTLSLVQVNIP